MEGHVLSGRVLIFHSYVTGASATLFHLQQCNVHNVQCISYVYKTRIPPPENRCWLLSSLLQNRQSRCSRSTAIFSLANNSNREIFFALSYWMLAGLMKMSDYHDSTRGYKLWCVLCTGSCPTSDRSTFGLPLRVVSSEAQSR